MRNDQLLALMAAILESGDRAEGRIKFSASQYVDRAAELMIQAGGDPLYIKQFVRLGKEQSKA